MAAVNTSQETGDWEEREKEAESSPGVSGGGTRGVEEGLRTGRWVVVVP